MTKTEIIALFDAVENMKTTFAGEIKNNVVISATIKSDDGKYVLECSAKPDTIANFNDLYKKYKKINSVEDIIVLLPDNTDCNCTFIADGEKFEVSSSILFGEMFNGCDKDKKQILINYYFELQSRCNHAIGIANSYIFNNILKDISAKYDKDLIYDNIDIEEVKNLGFEFID